MASGRVVARILRSGGIAGFNRRYEVDSAALDAAQRDQFERLVAEAELDRPPVPPRGADRFQYDFEVEQDGRVRRATGYDGSLPPGLRALSQWVLAHADSGE